MAANSPPSNAPQSPQPSSGGGMLRRPLAALGGWIAAKPNRKYYVFGSLAFLLFTGSTVAAVIAQRTIKARREPAKRPTLAMALDALDRESYSEARVLAEQIDREKLKATEQGGPDWVLGAVAAHEASELWGREKRNYFLLAAGHLEVARERNFAPANSSFGTLVYAESLYLAGKVAASRPLLEQALEENPDQSLLLTKLLAGAWRRKPDPDLPRALEYLRQYLAEPELSTADLESGLLSEANLLWRMEDYAGCDQALARIPADAYVRPSADLIRGRILMREARELKQKLADTPTATERQAVQDRYHEAIKVLRRAQDDPLGVRATRRSMYLIGACLMEMEDTRAALAQFERTRNVFLDTPEGLAAGLQEADLLLEMHRDDDALAAYRRMLGAVKDKPFTNLWIPPQEFRGRVLTAFQHYLGAGHYEQAIALAERLWPLFPQAESVRLTGEAYRTRGRGLLKTADSLPEPQASQTRAQGRATLRQAGAVFKQLADLEFTNREYPDDVWQSAECYLEGHQFTAAVAAIEEYLKYELRRRRPLALVNLGEALLALGRPDEAIEALAECIEFYGNDAASYRARLWSAKANADKGNIAAAEGMLRQNLNGELLTPESKEWRDSLFALGKLLVADGRYVEGVERLEEAVARYPDSRQAIEGRYLIAEACQLAAKVPQEKAATDSVETARLAHLKQVQQFLETAIHYYEQTQEVLNRRQEQTELNPLEGAMLRNSYFAVGAALVDLGRYEDAVRAYSAATNRYQHDPEVLEAFAQIASCYRHLNKPREARGAVQQAKAVLARIKPDASFADTTVYSRREWSELLDWMSKL